MVSLRHLASRLGRSGLISLRKDIFGVYGQSSRSYSLRNQADLINNKPFLRLALVTIKGANPSLQEDLDIANDIYQRDVGAWIYCVGSMSVDRPHLLTFDQDNCSWPPYHTVSDEEDELFNLGRDLGATIVCYFIGFSPGGFIGCASHPPGRRGFWVSDGAVGNSDTLVHELTHIAGGPNYHVPSDKTNLMYYFVGAPNRWLGKIVDETGNWVDQCENVRNDPDMVRLS